MASSAVSLFLQSICFVWLTVGLSQNYSSALRKTAGFPVVLVPGDGGSQIEARLVGKPAVVHYICSKRTSYYFDLWLNLELLAPYVLSCWVDNMRLVYNASERTTSDSPGVLTRIPGWGNTSTVEWLDPSQSSSGHYFATIVDGAVKWGYRRGKDIRGAPFDFRRAPNEAAAFFVNVKQLIEQTFYTNGNRKVVTIGHSMGNPYMLYFFNHMTQAWKDKFIRSHICISGPWGGSMKIMKLYASGYNFDHWSFVLAPLTVRPMQRSLPSSAFLMPSDRFWRADEVLVATATRNYTVADYEQFFADIHYPDGWQMRLDTQHLIADLEAPGVEVHCLHGVDVPTEERFEYAKGAFPDTQPNVVYGDGDGTVNLRSLLGCLRWRTQQKQPVHHATFPKQKHLEILKSADLVAYIRAVLTAADD